jgi:uncharacterized RDD family membrane protein YckC
MTVADPDPVTSAGARPGAEPVPAPFPRRLAAYIVDALASALIAALFVRQEDLPGVANHLPGLWSLVPFVLNYVVGMLVGGQTLGMRLLGVQVIRVDRPVPIGLWRTLVRTALLIVLIPALIYDKSNRGMHDRITDTAVVLT